MSRVLVLDDDLGRLKKFQQALIGHVAYFFETEDKAIQCLEGENTFDFVMLDHDLYGQQMVPSGPKTGYAVAAWLMVHPDKMPRKNVIIHTFNEQGAANMKKLLPKALYHPGIWMFLTPGKDIEAQLNDPAFINATTPKSIGLVNSMPDDKLISLLSSTLYGFFLTKAEGREKGCDAFGMVVNATRNTGEKESFIIRYEMDESSWGVIPVEVNKYPDNTMLYYHGEEADAVVQAALRGDEVVDDPT